MEIEDFDVRCLPVGLQKKLFLQNIRTLLY